MHTVKLAEDQAVKGLDYAIEIKVYGEGTQLIPSSAAITVKDPNGKAQVENQSMAIEDGVGTLTYTLSSTHTAGLWENAIIEVSYVVSSVTYKVVFFFDVVLCQLVPAVIDDDLKNYFPDLAAEIWTGESNYDEQIQEAFKIVKRDIKAKGRRPAMLIDGSQVRELVILKTFETIFFCFAKDESSIWWFRFQETKKAYADRFAKLVIKYDEDESGTVEEDEEAEPVGQVTMRR